MENSDLGSVLEKYKQDENNLSYLDSRKSKLANWLPTSIFVVVVIVDMVTLDLTGPPR